MIENSKRFNLWRMLFSGVIALGFTYQLFWSLYLHQASKSWQIVAAKVVAIESKPKSAELRYRFEYKDEEFLGNTFCYLSEGTLIEKDSIRYFYHVGDQIHVSVNPSNPHQSVVERRSLQIKYLWKHLLVIGFTGTLAVYSGMRLRRLSTTRPDRSHHFSEAGNASG